GRRHAGDRYHRPQRQDAHRRGGHYPFDAAPCRRTHSQDRREGRADARESHHDHRSGDVHGAVDDEALLQSAAGSALHGVRLRGEQPQRAGRWCDEGEMSMRMTTSHVAALALAFTFAAGQAAAASAVPAKSEDGKPYIGGPWVVEKGQAEAKTVDGKVPPLKPEAAALYAKRKAGGKSAGDPVEQCLPHGVPRILS